MNSGSKRYNVFFRGHGIKRIQDQANFCQVLRRKFRSTSFFEKKSQSLVSDRLYHAIGWRSYVSCIDILVTTKVDIYYDSTK